MANTATLTFGFTGTDYTRKYTFGGLSVADCENLKAKVLALNESISAGTAGGLSAFFISDDFDAAQGIGYFDGIKAAQYESSSVTDIPLA